MPPALIPHASLKKTDALVTRNQELKHQVSDQPSHTDDELDDPWTGQELVIASITELLRSHREMLELLREMDERMQHLERRASAKPPVLDPHAQTAPGPSRTPVRENDVSEQALLADLESLVRDASHTGRH